MNRSEIAETNRVMGQLLDQLIEKFMSPEEKAEMDRQLAELHAEDVRQFLSQLNAEMEALRRHNRELLDIIEDEGLTAPKTPSVQPRWCRDLPLQQQSVLMLAARGADGTAKHHPCKPVQIAYRGTVLVAAKYGRCLEWGEGADSFMSLDVLANDAAWADAVKLFFRNADGLPHHFLMHLMHGAQILGFKHPDERFRERWHKFYLAMVNDMHLHPESEADMDERLGDWGREHWA